MVGSFRLFPRNLGLFSEGVFYAVFDPGSSDFGGEGADVLFFNEEYTPENNKILKANMKV